MARVTVQDCLQQINNRFQLVLAAAKRAREISLGAEPQVDSENDKPTVLALREIAVGKIGLEVLDEVSAQAHATEPTVTEEEAREEMGAS